MSDNDGKLSDERLENGLEETPMQRINVRVDDRMKRDLEATARAQGVSPSDVVRAALEEHLRTRKPRETCLELAERIGVVGIYKDAPSDLSTNPIYMEGFGE